MDGSLISFRFALHGLADLVLVVGLPMSLLFQSVSHFLRHVSLVMLGKDGVGLESSCSIQRAFGNHTLAFAKEIREQAAIGNRNGAPTISDLKTYRKIFATHAPASFAQTADAQALPRLHVLFDQIG